MKELKGVNLANSGDEKRRALDFYPTPPEATRALIEFLNLPLSSIIWEPACGNGMMSKVIESYGYKVISTDIVEECYGEGRINYLTVPTKNVSAIITNPPFNLSALFIEKAVEEASVVAMLLKSQYWHSKKRLELFNKNKPSYILPLTWRPDFMGGERGGAPTMEVLWTVWIKGDNLTKYVPLSKPQNK